MDKIEKRAFDSQIEKIRKMYECDQFFVCGAPKSGTTWFQRALDTHPEVVCSGEGHFAESMLMPFAQLAKNYNKRMNMSAQRVYEGKPYYRGLKPDDMDFIAKIMMGLVMAQRQVPEGTKCVGDKTPRYTFRLPLLGRIFPDAKFIHVVRDGRDVVTSTCHHAYRAGHRGVIDQSRPEYFSYTAQSAKVWADNVRAAEGFGEKNPDRYYRVKYEAMHHDPENTLTSLFEFLGVSVDSDILKECIEKSEFKLFSGGREKGEEDKNSYFRKGVTGDWNNFLTKSALKGVYKNAGGMLKRMGYLEEAESVAQG